MIDYRTDNLGSLVTECFIYHLAPGCGPAYDAYHRDVWPEVQDQLKASGIVDYSIYRRDELVISVTTRDPSAPVPDLGGDVAEKVAQWGALMAPLFVAAADADGKPLFADRIFHL